MAKKLFKAVSFKINYEMFTCYVNSEIKRLFETVTHHAAMLPVAHATQGDEKNHPVLHTCMISPFFTPVGLEHNTERILTF